MPSAEEVERMKEAFRKYRCGDYPFLEIATSTGFTTVTEWFDGAALGRAQERMSTWRQVGGKEEKRMEAEKDNCEVTYREVPPSEVSGP